MRVHRGLAGVAVGLVLALSACRNGSGSVPPVDSPAQQTATPTGQRAEIESVANAVVRRVGEWGQLQPPMHEFATKAERKRTPHGIRVYYEHGLAGHKGCQHTAHCVAVTIDVVGIGGLGFVKPESTQIGQVDVQLSVVEHYGWIAPGIVSLIRLEKALRERSTLTQAWSEIEEPLRRRASVVLLGTYYEEMGPHVPRGNMLARYLFRGFRIHKVYRGEASAAEISIQGELPEFSQLARPLQKGEPYIVLLAHRPESLEPLESGKAMRPTPPAFSADQIIAVVPAISSAAKSR